MQLQRFRASPPVLLFAAVAILSLCAGVVMSAVITRDQVVASTPPSPGIVDYVPLSLNELHPTRIVFCRDDGKNPVIAVDDRNYIFEGVRSEENVVAWVRGWRPRYRTSRAVVAAEGVIPPFVFRLKQ